jgi:hypothetical protein
MTLCLITGPPAPTQHPLNDKTHTASPTPRQLTVAKEIIAKDGFGSLYKGLTAGLLRQATYTTTRLGVFQVISEKVRGHERGGRVGGWSGG